MAQAPAELTPFVSAQHFLGAELRHWRCLRGMSLTALGRAVHVSGDLIGKVEKAQRWPARDLVRRCDVALDSLGALSRLYRLAEVEHRGTRRPVRDGHQAEVTATSPRIALAGVGVIERPTVPGFGRRQVGGRAVYGVADVVDLEAARHRRAAGRGQRWDDDLRSPGVTHS